LNVVAPRHWDGFLVAYLGKVYDLLHDFNELLPSASTPAQELEQHQTFCVDGSLYGFLEKYFIVRDQVLGSTNVMTSSRKLFF